MLHRLVRLLAWACLLPVLLARPAAATELTISAAASLGDALRAIAPLYEAAKPGQKLALNLGASGALLAQIRQGAPVDVFITADLETMGRAQAAGLLLEDTRRVVAGNSLVLVTPVGKPAPASLAALRDSGFARIAIGQVASVPAGRYAQAALEAAQLWPAVEPKLIGATSVRQVLDYVARAEVDAGFVYATDAALMPDKVRVALNVPTPTPIQYPAAALRAAPNPGPAREFVAFLLTPPAQQVLARFGFRLP